MVGANSHRQRVGTTSTGLSHWAQDCVLVSTRYQFPHGLSHRWGPSRFSYGQQRSSEWFASLSLDVMKHFVPIDRWVFIGAKKIGALRPRSIRLTVQGIQANRRNHLQAASEIVEFAQQRNLDPRDLNAYWFMVGSKWIDGNGKPPP